MLDCIVNFESYGENEITKRIVTTENVTIQDV